MNDAESYEPSYGSEPSDPGTITMLEGGKVLFDESVGLQPVNLVEVPAAPNGHAKRSRAVRNGR
jgi:hypothetical protein